MIAFGKLTQTVNAKAIMDEVNAHPELWGQQRARLCPGSPHSETTDIWLRYRNLEDYHRQHGDNMARFVDQHVSVWLPPSYDLPHARAAALALTRGRRLGGVLLTRTPPGAVIQPHVDGGWHAEAHDKLYVALQVRPGAEFCWESGTINALDGEVYWFRNDLPHWVVNNSDADRIGMIVCLRRDT